MSVSWESKFMVRALSREEIAVLIEFATGRMELSLDETKTALEWLEYTSIQHLEDRAAELDSGSILYRGRIGHIYNVVRLNIELFLAIGAKRIAGIALALSVLGFVGMPTGDEGILEAMVSLALLIVALALAINELRYHNHIWALVALWSENEETKSKLADAILLFVCKPDEAETAAGDLFEEFEKVKARHGRRYCNVWFTWELTLLVIAKGRKRLFGPVLDLLKRKSG